MKIREALQLAGEHLAGNRLAEAEELYRRVLAASADNVAALSGLGMIGLRSGHPAEAAELLKRATASGSGEVDVRAALAEALHRSGKPAEAETIFQEMLTADPNCFPAFSRFGTALCAAGEFTRAEPFLRRAVALAPDSFVEQYRLGAVLNRLLRPREAIGHLERAVALRTDHVEAHMELGRAYLLAEDFPRGCWEMEWRWQLPGSAYPSLPYSRWDGKIQPDKTLLLVGEEGFGDIIQFASFIPEIIAAGMNVALTVRRDLASLLGSMRGLRVVENAEEVEHVDYYLPLLSLPLALGTTVQTLRRTTPYLAADPQKAADWRDRLGRDGLNVGLAWAGNPEHRYDANRSIALAALAPLTSIAGVRFHSLHVDPATRQAIASSGLPIHDHADLLRDFSDTAALISNLDLVVSIDSVAAHLAGALARPVWIMLPAAPDGRWMLERRDTPWYPTMRLFRQPRPGDWAAVIRDVAAELDQLAREGTQATD